MRPNTTVFFSTGDLTDTHLALARQLNDGGKSAPAETLTLGAAVRDLAASSRSSLAGRSMKSDRDRCSLRDDLARSFEGLGPELARHLSTEIFDLKSQLGALPAMLKTTVGSTVALGHAEQLLSVLSRPESAEAAWDDVVRSFEEGDDPFRSELRIAQLHAILLERGHEWEERARRRNRRDRGSNKLPAEGRYTFRIHVVPVCVLA